LSLRLSEFAFRGPDRDFRCPLAALLLSGGAAFPYGL